MDFLINNIGWFFCIAIVSVLALIGYKADKKEKQNNTDVKNIPKEETTNDGPIVEQNEEKEQTQNDDFYYNVQEEVKPIENNQPQQDEELAALYEPLPPMQSQNNVEEIKNDNKEENPINELYYTEPQKEQIQNEVQQQPVALPEQEISEPTQIVPDTNNLENLNISLQDLENKNYNQMLSKMNRSDLIQTGEQEIQTNIQKNIIDQEQPETQQLELNNNGIEQELTEQLQDSQQLETQQVSEQQEPQTEQIQNETIVNEPAQEHVEQSQQLEQQDNIEHQFDSEIINEENQITHQTVGQSKQTDDLIFNPQEKVYDGEIPELFSNNQQTDNSINDMSYLEKSEISKSETDNETNLYNDAIDDDIWKF